MKINNETKPRIEIGQTPEASVLMARMTPKALGDFLANLGEQPGSEDGTPLLHQPLTKTINHLQKVKKRQGE